MDFWKVLVAQHANKEIIGERERHPYGIVKGYIMKGQYLKVKRKTNEISNIDARH